jgi:hypothetical protein
VKPSASAFTVGALCSGALVIVALTEELLFVAIIAGAFGAAAAAFWDIRWAFHHGRYRIDLPDVAAFAGRYSFAVGESVPLYVHTTAPAEARVYRFGARREDTGKSFRLERALQSNVFVQRSGFDWPLTHELATDDLMPGLYGVEIRQLGDSGKAFLVPFIIRQPAARPIAVVLSTNTWDAYNEFGGVSKYLHHHLNFLARKVMYWAAAIAAKGTLSRVTLPVRRPNAVASNDLLDATDPWAKFHSRWIRAEWCLIAFLEEEGFDYALYTDEDLAHDDTVLSSDGMVIPGHSEYWSEEMFFAYDRFIARGGKVMIGAGMPMGGPVELGPDVKTYAGFDFPPEVSATRTGGHFTMRGALTAAPYRVTLAQSWIFEGTGIEDGELFGRKSAYQPVPDFAERAEAPPSGASGVWMNAVGRGSADFTLLARGLNEDGGAHMLYRDTPAGGWVFNAGSEAFLPAMREDARIARMAHNLLSDMKPATTRHQSVLSAETA